MKPRQKLRTTHVGTLGRGSLTDAVAPSERTTSPGSAPEAALPSEGDVVGGCYRLVRRLGEGMFGRVFEAERTDVPEHRVALKVVLRSVYAGRNVQRELVMLAAATHPHIVQLKDHGVARDYVWLTMALYEGETLAARLERGTLSMREAYEIFLPIARGLHALHQRGLRHQDVKPDNIFLARLNGETHPVLLDLGVAVERNATFVAGTALYGAPEQIVALGGPDGTATLSEKMDSYALAATLLLSLVGREHFPGESARTPYELAQASYERERRPLRPGALCELTGEPRRALDRALSRWLCRDPDHRPTIETLAEELDVLLEPEREASRLIESGIERQRHANRRMRMALLGVAAAGAVATLIGYAHRETLRLASELQQARAAGAASFSRLDTCSAAHRLAERRAERCEQSKQQARSAHEAAMKDLREQSAAAETAFSRRLTTVNSSLTTCRDEAEEAAEAFAAERADLESARDRAQKQLRQRKVAFEAARAEWVAEREALEQERASLEEERDRLAARRDELSERKTTLVGHLETRTEERDRCKRSLAACTEERDICLENAGPLTAKPSEADAPPPETPPPEMPPADDEETASLED